VEITVFLEVHANYIILDDGQLLSIDNFEL